MTIDNVEEGFQGMVKTFKPEIVEGWNVVIQYKIERGGDWFVEIVNEKCSLHKGMHVKPDLTISMDRTTWMAIVNEETTGERAYMFGQLKASGDMDILIQHDEIFNRSENA